MSLLMKTTPVTDSGRNAESFQSSRSAKKNDELTLTLSTTNTQTSTMSEEIKRRVRGTSPGLEELFIETVERKGEGDKLQVNRLSDSELEIEGISQMTLHSFLLKAEELGKNITYTRSLKVEITD